MLGDLIRSYPGLLVLLAAFFLYSFSLIFPALAVFGAGLIIAARDVWRNPEKGIYMTIFFLPFTKSFYFPLVGDKLGLPDLVFLLTLSVFVLKRELTFDNLRKSWSLPATLLVLFLVFVFASFFNAVSTTRWLVEAATYSYLAILFIFLIIVVNTKDKVKKSLVALAASLSIIIITGLAGHLMHLLGITNSFVAPSGRTISIFKAVNQFSLYLFTGFFLLVRFTEERFMKEDKKGGLLLFSLAAAGVLLVMLSGTKLALAVMITGLLVYSFLQVFLQNNSKVHVPALLLLIALSLVFVPLSNDKAKESLEKALENGQEDNSVLSMVKRADRSRYYQLKAFSGMFREHPLIGVGAGNFAVRIIEFSNSSKEWEMHSTFLGILAETGLLGLLSFLAFLFVILKDALKKIKSSPYVLPLGIGIASHFLFSLWQFGLRTRLLWTCMALVVCLSKDLTKYINQ